jgi:hypothetical protein
MRHENAAAMVASPDLEAEIEALQSMGLTELRACWSERWGCAPKLRSLELLRLMIAWRLQAAALGGLNDTTRRRLKQSSIPWSRPPAGIRLTREFRGVLYHVDVGLDDFTYTGRAYNSLSEIAREITGTRWNGPRFFGLRQGPGQ